MSRSRHLIAAAITLLPVLAAPPLHAEEQSTTLDVIETIDYARGRSAVPVGSWARYHVTGKSDLGVVTDYTVTVLVAGEERFWGEDCFWLETWNEPAGRPLAASATLMSFAVFDDSLVSQRLSMYQRKLISGLDEHNNPEQVVMRRGPSAYKVREEPGPPIVRKVDSLGTEVVKTVKGEFLCTKVRRQFGIGQTSQSADSTEYIESRKIHTSFRTPAIPVTGLAREDLDYGMWRRTWLTGRSQESNPLNVMDHSIGAAELVDFGRGGLEPRLVPAPLRRSLAEQDAARAAAKSRPAAGKRAGVRR